MKTALNQLEEWILKFEKVNGTPTMCEIKAQIEMFKEVEKEQLTQAYENGSDFGINDGGESADNYFADTFC